MEGASKLTKKVVERLEPENVLYAEIAESGRG